MARTALGGQFHKGFHPHLNHVATGKQNPGGIPPPVTLVLADRQCQVQDGHGAPWHGRTPLPTHHVHVFDQLSEVGVLFVGHDHLRLHLLASTFNDHLGLIHLKQVHPLQVPQAPEQDLKHNTRPLGCLRHTSYGTATPPATAPGAATPSPAGLRPQERHEATLPTQPPNSSSW